MLAIRREDQSVWERRAPFNPSHVKRLVKNGVKVIVQPSNRRSYPMQVIINNERENGKESTNGNIIYRVNPDRQTDIQMQFADQVFEMLIR